MQTDKEYTYSLTVPFTKDNLSITKLNAKKATLNHQIFHIEGALVIIYSTVPEKKVAQITNSVACIPMGISLMEIFSGIKDKMISTFTKDPSTKLANFTARAD